MTKILAFPVLIGVNLISLIFLILGYKIKKRTGESLKMNISSWPSTKTVLEYFEESKGHINDENWDKIYEWQPPASPSLWQYIRDIFNRHVG
ncbi:MAG: hypothetical protein GY847_18070 [Proteobacteria bacterium]|nr:hypothetical protein [Pseudomonadota bacterium]